MKKIIPIILLLNTVILKAQSPDWAIDIAPILYKNCTQCHHSGGMAPFSLMTYNDAFAVQLGMADAVNNRRMPPWPPDPTYLGLAHEKLLTTSEIQSINDWLNTGAASGNLSLAPTPPVYTNGSQLGSPDLSLNIPAYTVSATSDIYRCFPIPSGLSAQQFITAMEVIPGNPAIVHHVLVYADDASTCYSLDSADPGPGYTNFGGPGSATAKLIGAWVPGAEPYSLPATMGISLSANTNIIVQIHYPAGSLNMTDTTQVNFKLSLPPMREVSIFPLLNHSTSLVNGPLAIPANTIKIFHEKFTTNSLLSYSLLSIAPHMHLIAKDIVSYGVTSIGDTIPFIKINNWDFRWQGNYAFRKVQKIPGGITLHAFATYDNTSNNLNNPNTPPQYVSLGESTTDEMMLVYFFFLPYLPGDENIVIDSAAITGVFDPYFRDVIKNPQLYDIYPNPTLENIHIGFYLPQYEELQIILSDLQGRVIANIKEKASYKSGMYDFDYAVNNLPKGTYLITIQSPHFQKSKSFIKD